MRRPVDLGAVGRDDELLDALGRGEAPRVLVHDHVARLLYEWRQDIDSQPVRRSRRWRRASRRLVVGALATVLGLASAGGVTAAAAEADPGSALWPVTRVVYSERAESLQARRDAELALAKAREAAAQQQRASAARYLDLAVRHTRKVRAGDGAVGLRQQAEAMRQRIAVLPPPVRRAAPVPVPVPPGTSAADAGPTAPDTIPDTGPDAASAAPPGTSRPRVGSPRPVPTPPASPRPSGTPTPSPGAPSPSSPSPTRPSPSSPAASSPPAAPASPGSRTSPA